MVPFVKVLRDSHGNIAIQAFEIHLHTGEGLIDYMVPAVPNTVGVIEKVLLGKTGDESEQTQEQQVDPMPQIEKRFENSALACQFHQFVLPTAHQQERNFLQHSVAPLHRDDIDEYPGIRGK